MGSELFHVLNRGVEKRRIFMDASDHARFVHDLYEFNDTAPAPEYHRRANVGGRSSHIRERLVDIHAWSLMPNHYHLLLSERIECGISLFMQKMNGGYAMYFNEKYARSGTLFQGRTKKVLIEREAHFLHILHYIHLNPLDLLKGAEEWRDLRIRDQAGALEHLARYRWSSYLDYCGIKNFPSLITKELFAEVFPDYRRAIATYLRDIEELPEKLTLE
jgi:putative transposase